MYADLKGKRVLVTGSSSGIGAGIATAFARQGARLLLHFRRNEEGAQAIAQQVREAGAEAFVFGADLRYEKAIDALLSFSDKRWGGLDVLVNNAGVVLKASAADATSIYWDNVLNINLRAPYLLSRGAARRMIAAGNGGTILNISSVYAEKCPQNYSAYAASKAGLEALTRGLALEWAPHRIRVNAVAPGVVPVERTRAILEETAGDWLPRLPLGRYGKPEDIGMLSVFLCSEASAWTTGQTYTCDGGMIARPNVPDRAKPPLPPLPTL